ncbi:histidine phosphatase family protein [Paracoccus sp. (in: a-proteobacteria)]|uniref:histidine phosphatase family protein n=1 Tax=Paracoccus sp. TaxID=267 RepID=UPI0026DF7174|nr:histidine phosphatase family protein [Paracoccus sp. (in: a-proteobacteria)]MDO5646504.1 histidine phosphatase family protein [Paracoccus sp. (in: a-proteobacteria)]
MDAQMIPDLYLMRHGETLWNRERRMQGRLDSPLTDLGRRQAAQQAALFAGLTADRISSPQGRAQDTARIVFNAPFRTDPRLMEIDVGIAAGQRADDLRRDHPDLFTGGWLDWYDRVPGGEHFSGLRARVADFLADLTAPAMIVTHGVTLRMIWHLTTGEPLDQPRVIQGALHVIRGGRSETWR